MRKRGFQGYSRLLLLAVVIAGCFAPAAFAETSNSSHYQATQMQFGSGSTDQTCSSSYCSSTSIGDISGGPSSSANSTASFGRITDSQPLLEVIVTPGQSNLGVLTSEHTATKTSTIQVRNYLSGGYVLQITGDPPKYANHTLNTPTTPTASAPGTEQFGINIVANDNGLGANPVQVPDATTSFGFAESGYDTPNRFKYASGDVVGRSLKASGRTDYTISFIVNIANNTPAGHYTGDYSAVVIPVY